MRRLSTYLFSVALISRMYAATSNPCTLPASLQAKITTQPKAQNYAEAGLWFAAHRKFSCAVDSYRNAVAQAPESADLLYLLGLNLIRNGDASNAVQPLQRSVELTPSVLKPHLLLATAFEQLGRVADARSEWTAALKIDPRSEIALDGASKNFLAAREFDAAIALLSPAPKSESLMLDLALAHQGAGKPDEATQILRTALKLHPSSPGLTSALVRILATQARYQEAVQIAAKSAHLRPLDLEAQKLYLHVLILSDDEKAARPLARKLLVWSPRDFAVLYLNGLLEIKASNYAVARDYLQKAVLQNPEHYDSRYNLGLALENLDDAQGARGQFEKALALGATDPSVRFEYVKVLRSLGESTLAQEQLKLYQQEQKAQADRTLAASKIKQGDQELNSDPGKAAQLYRDALAVLPNYALLHYKLSVALDRRGDIDGEREALQKAVEIDPRMAVAHRQLGYLAFNDGDFATAETHFRHAVEAAPTFADAWVSLAAALASESRPEEAAQAVKRALEIDPQNTNAAELQKELANAVGQAHP